MLAGCQRQRQRQRRVQTCERRSCRRSGLLGRPAFRPFASPRPRPTLKQKPPLWCNRIRRNVCDSGDSSSVYVVFVLGTDLFGPRSPSLPYRLWNPIFDFFAILNSGRSSLESFPGRPRPARVRPEFLECNSKSRKNQKIGFQAWSDQVQLWSFGSNLGEYRPDF